ncbi:MAG: transposase [Eubacteriaceae bacterium]|nr:transposase [Eubacteriaceae bacterium]
MIAWLNEALSTFKQCFTRTAAYKWFVVVVIGFMARSDSMGLTSVVRELHLNPACYHSLLHFFRSRAWTLDKLESCWIRLVSWCGHLFFEDGMPVLVGDGMKQAKEAKKMPCVKKLHQESENYSKGAYIFGHMFGAIGVLAGNASKMFYVPLSMRIHDGDKMPSKWAGPESVAESHAVRIVRDACRVAKGLVRKSILLLDRYSCLCPLWKPFLGKSCKLASHCSA